MILSMSKQSLVFVILFTISLPLHIVDHETTIHQQRKSNLHRFSPQSPSLSAFNLPAHISDKYGIKASEGSGIYGISGPNYKDGECALVKYNTRTGNATTIRRPNARIITGQSYGCLDAVHNIYFFLYEERRGIIHVNSGLYPYNLVDNVTYDPISLPMINMGIHTLFGAGDVCVSDPNTGDLFVFGVDATKTGNQLLLKISFDPSMNNSSITQIGEYSVNDAPLAGTAIALYDNKRNMLWVTAETVNDDVDYFYINAITGQLKKKINSLDVDIETATYNVHLDTIVGVNAIVEDTNGYPLFQMVHADPVTLNVTKRFDTFSNDYCFWTSLYTQDVDGGVYYGMLYQSPVECDKSNNLIGVLIGVNVSTGNVLSQPQICTYTETVLTCPWDLFYWKWQ